MDASAVYALEILSLCQTFFFLAASTESFPSPSYRKRPCGQSRARLRWYLLVSVSLTSLRSPRLIRDRWEFITTLDFEWEVYTGRRPWRWSFIVYVMARVLALICIIISLVGFNVTREFNCNVSLSTICRTVKRTLTS
jgi:hypothetical protein